MDTNVSVLIAFLDQRQLGPVRSVLLVIIGWLVGNTVFSETALKIFLIFYAVRGLKKVEKSQSRIFEKNS